MEGSEGKPSDCFKFWSGCWAQQVRGVLQAPVVSSPDELARRYKTPRQLVHDMLYGTFEGNDATRWGNTHEQVACDEYMLTRNAERGEDAVKVSHSGLNVHEEMRECPAPPLRHISAF